MKKLRYLTLLLLFALANVGNLWAQTFVGTDIVSNTTWTLIQSPIIVTNNVQIDPGVTLQVDPGVEVRLENQVVLKVKGVLEALGTPGDSIFFIADQIIWEGIEIDGGSFGQVRLSYCDLSESGSGIYGNGLTGNDHLRIDHCRLRSNGTSLSQIPVQLFEISFSSFEDNFYGIDQAVVSLRHCHFNRNTVGIHESSIEVDSCTFNKSSLVAIEGGSGSVKRSSFFYNQTALSGFGTSLADTIFDCEIALSDTGAIISNNLPRYFANEFCGNQVAVKVVTSNNVNISGNCWCTPDSHSVDQNIWDGHDDSGIGFLDFMPMDSCNYPGIVWPGDANSDGTANIVDLLSIGVAFGTQGAARPNATQFWAAQTGVPWGLTFANGIDYIHADCNGNGSVSLADTLAILTNFAQSHQKAAFTFADGGVPVCLIYPDSAGPGDTILVDIFVGDSLLPAQDAYGFAISLGYDRSNIDSSKIDPQLVGTWLGGPGQNIIDLAYSELQYHWAISRNDQQDTVSWGRIGGVEMVMIDDLAKVVPINITVESATMVDKNGAPISLSLGGCNQNARLNQGLNVYPNPVTERMTVDWNEHQIQKIEIYGPGGQRIYQRSNPDGHQLEVLTDNYPTGIYLVKARVGEGFLTRKIMVIR